jgi:hypothetical protein
MKRGAKTGRNKKQYNGMQIKPQKTTTAAAAVVVVVVQSKFNNHQITGKTASLKTATRNTVNIWPNIYSTD